MKIAILILAHKNPGQLRKLIDRLKVDFEVFIHFDKNSNISGHFADEEGVHILKKRYKTHWGSNNIVLAETELLREAFANNCDYYILISGQDLPLMSNSEIIDFITSHYGDYIECCKMPSAYWGMSGGLDRVSLFWETKNDRPLSFPIKVTMQIVRQLQKKLNLKRTINFDLYGGAQWFNLTKEAVTFILTFIDKNEHFVKRFRHTRASDEIFLQTILMSFDYPKKLKIKEDHLRYFDWKTGPTYPRILTMEDLDKCIRSGKLFGRKFDEDVDGKVIQHILMDKE